MKSQKAGKAFHSIQAKVTTYTLLAVLMMAFFACGTVAPEEEKKVFHYNESNGISSLDPAFARNLENMWAVNQLFDGLVELNDELEVQPLIAKSWTIDSTGKHYSFQLRSEVYFHPSIHFGTPDSTRKVTAGDFKYSFSRIVDEKTASPGKWIFNQVDFEHNGGFEVLNDSTFNIHLKAPFAPFLSMLS
ncbi:MAG: ABC transporter substrate-binding protein, partial [Flavobacteriales bacterium]|nr:ABC transporter substrate-binding protein [Flavobacteriales bacterium]